MNVLKIFPYTKTYYLTHPWEFFKQCGRNLRAAYQRITLGYAKDDVWDIEAWFKKIMPEIIATFRSRVVSHPSKMTFEEWCRILEEMETHFRNSTKDIVNEYEDNYIQQKYDNEVCREDFLALSHNYTMREKEIAAYKEAEFKKAMELFTNCCEEMWD